jgi:hypothetical protein
MPVFTIKIKCSGKGLAETELVRKGARNAGINPRLLYCSLVPSHPLAVNSLLFHFFFLLRFIYSYARWFHTIKPRRTHGRTYKRY